MITRTVHTLYEHIIYMCITLVKGRVTDGLFFVRFHDRGRHARLRNLLLHNRENWKSFKASSEKGMSPKVTKVQP